VDQVVHVHYTGWLFDNSAPDNKGKKFDSSRDRPGYFTFPLGARWVAEHTIGCANSMVKR
jgi:FKBP-type peptidyl-prolyl cis-trans isomerase FkpA